MTPRSTRPARFAAATLALPLLLLAGCTDEGGTNTVAGQAREVADRAYNSGDGRIETLAPDERGEPVELTGRTLTGEDWSSVDHRGGIVVLNVWGSWCPPCVSEMPELEKAWNTLQKRDHKVQFMGVNTGGESPATAAAFLQRTGTSYPSLEDDGGVALIALQEKASTPPTTLVLDTQGRIAARVVGETTAATLTGLVDDVAAKD